MYKMDAAGFISRYDTGKARGKWLGCKPPNRNGSAVFLLLTYQWQAQLTLQSRL